MTPSSNSPEPGAPPTVSSVLAAESEFATPSLLRPETSGESPSDPPAAPSAAPERPSALSTWLMVIALVGTAGALLLISPDPDAERVRPWPEGSWLLQVVRIQALGYLFPTLKGVEIKDTAFYLAACVLSMLGAGALLLRGAPRRPDGRSPLTWAAVLFAISGLSIAFASAPRAAAGGTVIRFLWLAWWWPLAIWLTPRDARRLCIGLIILCFVTAVISLWYRAARAPGAPLSYPMGTIGGQLFLAACLLPALAIAGTLAVAQLWPYVSHAVGLRGDAPMPEAGRRDVAAGAAWFCVACFLAYACYRTGSRSALLGLSFGVLAMVYLAADRQLRNWMKLATAGILGIVIGTILLFGSDATATAVTIVDWLTGRTESIRARVEHEWPYAWHMFRDHPWIGSGEGGFSRGVGPLVRARQLQDPMLLNADNTFWESHAHNELLETMVSLGAAGTAALLAAVFLTWRGARRGVDASSGRPRLWIIAVTGAFVALCVEELTDVALHKPGLAPIFLTVWACVVVLTRGVDRGTSSGSAAPGASSRIFAGVAGCATLACTTVALGLMYYDASALRAQFESERISRVSRPGQREAAIPLADRALRWRLNPARYLESLLRAIHHRVNAAIDLGRSTDPADLDRSAQLCHEALALINRLDATSPRYVRVREFEGVTYALLSSMSARRGDGVDAREYEKRSAAAFLAHREDEPFQMDAVEAAWRTNKDVAPGERVRWLRDILRGGEIPQRWDALLESLGADAAAAVDPLLQIAVEDARMSPAQWRDPLSPETLRLAARASYLAADSRKANDFAKAAIMMYSVLAQGRTGNRLAWAHGAALHEQAEYAFDLVAFAMNPALQQQLLGTLDRARAVYFRTEGDAPLDGPIGRTRLAILLFLGKEEAARPTVMALAPKPDAESLSRTYAQCYLALVAQFGGRAQGDQMRLVLEWSRRAALLDPREPLGHRFTATAALQLGLDDLAREAVRQYRLTQPRTETAEADLEQLRKRFPNSPVWGGAATAPAPESASQPATSHSEDSVP